MWEHHWMTGPYMWIFWIAVIIGLAVLIGWLFSNRKDRGSRIEENPLDILKERYARGEIDRKEFMEKKKDLQ